MDVRSNILTLGNAATKKAEKVRDSIRKSSNLSTRWGDPRCKDEADKLVERLLQPGMLEFIATHEAGHDIYFGRAGCTTKPQPSRIIYHQETDLFVGQLAAIEIDKCEAETEGDPGLVKMAEGYAAGGGCARKLKPKAEYFGDTDDREQFFKLYAKHHPDKSGESVWLEAQETVRKDIRGGLLRAQIDKRAEELLQILFPWLTRKYS